MEKQIVETLFILKGGHLMANKKGNNYIIDEENGIAKIELNRRNAENLWTTIDLEDLERVINFPYTWFAKYYEDIDSYYACASQYIPELKHARTILMHQFIMGIDRTAREFNVDHQNHNTLDNRKENLRITNVPNNSKNRQKRNSNNKSGYRNVCWNSSRNRWVVQLQVDGKNKVLGTFKEDELEKAGKFAEEMRQKYYGEFAGKN